MVVAGVVVAKSRERKRRMLNGFECVVVVGHDHLSILVGFRTLL
jgi:hypothetical protein